MREHPFSRSLYTICQQNKQRALCMLVRIKLATLASRQSYGAVPSQASTMLAIPIVTHAVQKILCFLRSGILPAHYCTASMLKDHPLLDVFFLPTSRGDIPHSFEGVHDHLIEEDKIIVCEGDGGVLGVAV